jgi:hypothetical protein
MQPWQLGVLGVRSPGTPRNISAVARATDDENGFVTPSGTTTPPQVAVEAPGTPSRMLAQVLAAATRNAEDALRSPPKALPASTSNTSVAESGGVLSADCLRSARGGTPDPNAQQRRAAQSVKLASGYIRSTPVRGGPPDTSLPTSPTHTRAPGSSHGAEASHGGGTPQRAGLAAGVTRSPVDPRGVETRGPPESHSPFLPASPYDRHAVASRRERDEHLRDAFIRTAEQTVWARDEGVPVSAEELSRRESDALAARKLHDRHTDFLQSLELAAEREAAFLMKGDAAKRRALEREALECGLSPAGQQRATRYGVAAAVLTAHKAAQVEHLAVDIAAREIELHQSGLMAPFKGAARTVSAAGTTREAAEEPPIFSFDLTEEEKHWLMCAMKFAVSADCIANDADFRSRLGWYRGDVKTQFAKLANTFSQWSCVCFNRGVTWNMLHNCLCEARKPIAWTTKPTSRAAYFGRSSVSQISCLHDRLLKSFSDQLAAWRAGGRDAAASFSELRLETADRHGRSPVGHHSI